MKWPAWFNWTYRPQPAPAVSLTECPKCGREMIRVDKSTMSGRDMRTYRCEHCGDEHVVDFGIALWKAMSDARESDK
jgi:predicted RNA-binding Zn-ribbon protein involved in translation (DUF1610 family)